MPAAQPRATLVPGPGVVMLCHGFASSKCGAFVTTLAAVVLARLPAGHGVAWFDSLIETPAHTFIFGVRKVLSGTMYD